MPSRYGFETEPEKAARLKRLDDLHGRLGARVVEILDDLADAKGWPPKVTSGTNPDRTVRGWWLHHPVRPEFLLVRLVDEEQLSLDDWLGIRSNELAILTDALAKATGLNVSIGHQRLARPEV